VLPDKDGGEGRIRVRFCGTNTCYWVEMTQTVPFDASASQHAELMSRAIQSTNPDMHVSVECALQLLHGDPDAPSDMQSAPVAAKSAARSSGGKVGNGPAQSRKRPAPAPKVGAAATTAADTPNFAGFHVGRSVEVAQPAHAEGLSASGPSWKPGTVASVTGARLDVRVADVGSDAVGHIRSFTLPDDRDLVRLVVSCPYYAPSPSAAPFSFHTQTHALTCGTQQHRLSAPALQVCLQSAWLSHLTHAPAVRLRHCLIGASFIERPALAHIPPILRRRASPPDAALADASGAFSRGLLSYAVSDAIDGAYEDEDGSVTWHRGLVRALRLSLH
jgi:hypothetical protein